ncbi:MAG: GntR family transcriptional regulator [Planctomycetaceae bacterium]|nr:GntR family transcriptional regulator [Planctomycetaceae bacterium]
MNVPPRLPREKARDYALRVLRENIISLTLEPGARVSENELSSELGLSRTPVREALIELGNYGIVEIFPQHGSVISKIDYRHIEEARFMRLALETAAVAEVCDIATAEDVEELEDSVQIQKMYMDNGNAKMLLKMDNKFHRGIFAACDKLVSYTLMQNMAVHFDRVRQLSLTTVKDIKIIEDHRAIVEAIKAHDKERARDVMTLHLSRYKTDKTLIQDQYRRFIRE